MPYFDGYNIDAHRDNISDLPQKFIEALSVSMEDKSYGNDVCSSFGMIHPDKDKMYHLFICSEEDVRISEYPIKRFHFNIVYLYRDAEYREGCNSYLVETNLEEVELIVSTNSLDLLAERLSDVFPAFKAIWQVEGT